MRGSAIRRLLCVPAAAAVAVSVACAASPITSTRLEAAVAPTFANLVQVQVSWLGLPAMHASEFGVKATCRRLVGRSAGSGEWVCVLAWRGPDRRPLRDTFELFVTTDGCYSAAVEGDALGGPTLKTPDGREVRNLLYAFEGCFDTT